MYCEQQENLLQSLLSKVINYWKWYELFSNGKVVTYGCHGMIQMTCIHDI
jgi:hypothetical protein